MSIENSSHVDNVRLISFSDIIPNHHTVVRISSDGLVFAIDLVMALTGRNKDKANQSLRSISDEDFHLENYIKRPISGSTQFNKLVTFQHAMDLVMLVPCMKLSTDIRIQFANVIKKLMDDYVPAPTMDAAELNPRTMISFADVVEGRNAFVRVTADKMIYAVDLVMVVTGLSRDDSGKTLRRLSDEIFPSDKFSERTLPGKGNAHTKLVSLQNAIELIMVLPGKLAKEFRVQSANIIRRYMAGDQSLVAEMEANAQAVSPIAQMARETLGDIHEDQGHKRQRIEETKNLALSNINAGIDIMAKLYPAWRNDGDLVSQLRDQVKDILTSDGM